MILWYTSGMERFIPYYRVSTKKQGKSGYGLEAQRLDAMRLIGDGCVLAPYTEIETGKNPDRPELAKAIAHARLCNATLVVAKLDRLARDMAFTSALMASGLKFVCCDCPTATEFTLHILAAVAQEEARMIGERTRKGLAAAKAKGKKLGSARPGHWTGREHRRGFKQATARAAEVRRRVAATAYSHLLPQLTAMRAAGQTMEEVAAWLNDNGHCTRAGNPYTVASVWRLYKRYAPEYLGNIKNNIIFRKN